MGKARTKNIHDEISKLKPLAVLFALLAIGLVIYFAVIKNIKPVNNDSIANSGETLCFDSDAFTIEVGQREKLPFTFNTGEIIDTSLLFTTLDGDVLTVDNSGYISSLSVGTAVVKVMNNESGMSDEIIVNVTEATVTSAVSQTTTTAAVTTAPAETTTAVATTTTTQLIIDWVVEVETISLNKTEITIDIWETEMPMVTMLPSSAKDKSERWTSSDTNIAVVDPYGNIRGMSAGQCVITVTSVNNPALSASVNVTVTDNNLAEGATIMEGVMLVNKSYPLPTGFVPDSSNDYGLDDSCYSGFRALKKAAAADNINIYISSSYRSYSRQATIFANYVSSRGLEAADTFSARPGFSEHQTGLAIDVNITNDSFAGTAEAKWLAEHAHEYGFIVRYPEDKQSITGYKYEPWHIRYVGIDFATKLHESGLCMEEYFSVESVYAEDYDG